MPISAGRQVRTTPTSMPCCGIRQIDRGRRHPRGWFNLGVQGCRHLDRVTAMRSSLDHLPPHKQRELERIVQIVFEEFEDVLALATQDWKRKGRISKIILYGSYARGGWVDRSEEHTSELQSLMRISYAVFCLKKKNKHL